MNYQVLSVLLLRYLLWSCLMDSHYHCPSYGHLNLLSSFLILPSPNWKCVGYSLMFMWHSTCSSSAWKILTWQYSYLSFGIQVKYYLLCEDFLDSWAVSPLCSHRRSSDSSHWTYILLCSSFLLSWPMLSNRNIIQATCNFSSSHIKKCKEKQMKRI